MSFQETVGYVENQCKKLVGRFTEDSQRLPSWGSELNEQVQVYMWTIGSLHWTYDHERHFEKRGRQIAAAESP